MLSYHGVFLSGVFFVDFFDVGSEDFHFGLALVAFVGEWEEDYFDEDCEQEYDDAVVPVEVSQEVEDRDYDECVDPAE